MKKTIVILLCVLLCAVCISCTAENGGSTPDKAVFTATVTSVFGESITVEPHEDTGEIKSADKISMSLTGVENVPEIAVGDVVSIEYDGSIMETYPARLGKVYSITKIE